MMWMMHATPAGSGEGRPAPWTLRMAAVAALLAPAAMVVVAAIALAGDVAIAILAVVLVLVACAAIWFALTASGTRRVVGAALAALVAAGLIVVLATHSAGGAGAGCAAAAARRLRACCALCAGTRGEAAARTAIAGSVTAGSAERAVLIINLKSGGGKAERFDLVGEARRRGIEPIVLQPGDDLLELAEGAIARGAEAVGMAGGDGSQALVATVAARRDVAHVCIPAGTRNHFALDLGLDRDDVVGALDAFGDGGRAAHRPRRGGGRVFVNNASLGSTRRWCSPTPTGRQARGRGGGSCRSCSAGRRSDRTSVH